MARNQLGSGGWQERACLTEPPHHGPNHATVVKGAQQIKVRQGSKVLSPTTRPATSSRKLLHTITTLHKSNPVKRNTVGTVGNGMGCMQMP